MGNISHPEYPKKEDFLHGSPFCHAPCMVRKEAYDAVKGYNREKAFVASRRLSFMDKNVRGRI